MSLWKAAIIVSALEGANGPRGGLKRQPKGSPDQELGVQGLLELKRGKVQCTLSHSCGAFY